MNKKNTLLITAKVTPNAKSENIKKTVDSEGAELYRITVTATPENGKANKAVIALLAKHFKVPKSSIHIKRGSKNKEKVIEILLPECKKS